MDFLWQKESKNNSLYVNLFKNTPVEFRKSCFENICKYKAERTFNLQKSDKKSSVFQTNGNKAFKTNDWREAMKYYNASLCFAEKNSEFTSLAYANRSACFFRLKMYKKCLVDIELAKEANYPTHLMPELESRRQDCLRLMKCSNEFGDFVPKLSYDDDDRFPGMANVLHIEFNKKFGRHIIAKTDIPAGQTILVEDAFTSRLVGVQHINCSACLRTTMNFIACAYCTSTLFCDSRCANANDYHKIECEEHAFDTKSPNEFYMRSILIALNIFETVDSLMQFVEEALNETTQNVPEPLTNMKSKYRALLQLNTFASEKNKKLYFRPAYMIYHSLMMMKSIKKKFDSESKRRFLMHLSLHHYVVISINNFRNVDYETIEDEAAFIICSYFNHACAPHVMVKRAGKLRYCVTVRPIKAGQQLFVTYFGDLRCEQSVQHCQEYLAANLDFRCECERCKPNFSKSDLHSLLSSDPEYTYLCSELFKQPARGYDLKKLAHLQEKCVDLLNRYGEHWCDELDSIIEEYESISDQIVLTKQKLPLGREESSNVHYLSVIILIISILIYDFFIQKNN